MIFIFTTAICGYAQEAPAAEQNDDSELILRHQNRRTMRGYKMLFEAGYQWGLPDKEGFLCGVYDPDKWSVGASAGFQFNNFVFLGGGTDFQLYRSGGNTYLTVPVFGELRINVLNYKIPCSGVISRPAASTSCRSFFITSAGIHLRSTLTVRTRLRLRTMSIGA